MKQRFDSFSELSRHKREGEDYAVTVQKVAGSKISVVAPHGGTIEFNTCTMARRIAANDHNLYVFEGLSPAENAFFELHVESRFFDEPRCLDLIAGTDRTVTIHGCRDMEPVVYIGGLDADMKASFMKAFNDQGIRATDTGHPYPGTTLTNICNRNTRGQGLQLEFSRGIRDDEALLNKCIDIVRHQLKGL